MNKAIIYTLFLSIFFTGSCQHISIDEYLQKQYFKGELNGNILVVQNEKILYENAFGIANAKTKEPLTLKHRFNVGSIYKEFPGVAIMQLKERGRLKLTDTIGNYLAGLPRWSQKINIQHLLQYSSGLPQIPWDDYFFKNNIPVTEKSALELLNKTEELAFNPGSDYLYSNYNPLLLTLIVEKITGKPFESYVEKNLFRPAKLSGAFFAQQAPHINEKHIANAFDEGLNTDSYVIHEPKFLMNFTAQDLYQWLVHLHNHELISKESVEILSKRVGSQSPLGVLEWDKNNLIVHHHHGSSGNYEAVIRYYPDDALYIIIVTNQKHSNVSKMADKIHAIASSKKD